MRKLSFGIAFFIVLVCSIAASPLCRAQGLPDSTLNNIIDDTIHRRKPVPDTNTVIVGRSTADSTPLVARKRTPFQPNPKKAGLYSALLPGLGQIYNRQYWKLSLVYAGAGAVGYFFFYNLNNYQSYRAAYIGRIGNPNPKDRYVGTYTDAQLQQLQSDANKYKDLTVLLGVVGYTLQVLDAVTAAHLKNFDISRDISMRVQPLITPQGGIGFGLAMNFK